MCNEDIDMGALPCGIACDASIWTVQQKRSRIRCSDGVFRVYDDSECVSPILRML